MIIGNLTNHPTHRYRNGQVLVERRGRLRARQLLELIANYTVTDDNNARLRGLLHLDSDDPHTFRDEEDDFSFSMGDLFAGLAGKQWELID